MSRRRGATLTKALLTLSCLLAAPLGFLADGSSYHLLTPRPLQAGEPATLLLEWLRRSAAA